MGNAVVTLRVMPKSPDIDLSAIEKKALAEVKEFNGGKDTKVDIQPIAFGLKAVNIIFVMDENQGNPDAIAETVAKIEGVNS
ncbi:elongation factor 1-beta, partial [Candidatus Woesearchaeota archaeon]|nr:elongation factor 1-beta [Candidatus Woesearchaeota archaeon]